MAQPPKVKVHGEGEAPTPSQFAVATREATVTDKRGRAICIRKVGALQRTRLFRLMGSADAQNMPLLGHYQLVASVASLDGAKEPFPTSVMQIEALLDRLDDDGLAAVAEGWRANGWVEIEDATPENIRN